jgi:hypothetical protein
MEPDKVRTTVRAIRNIDGWFSAEAAQLFGLLDTVQVLAGIQGHLFEIGVHHGRSTVVLSHMARAGERVRVCDIFGNQGDNVSRSGSGDRAIFERNIAALAPDSAAIDVFEKRSDHLTPPEIGGPYRFFHIDGGHLADEALGDLRLAAGVLHEAGVIVVDDPFRPEWPGVTEATIRFLDERKDLAAIAVGFNKLVLCRREARAAYDAMLASPWDYVDSRIWETKELPFVGEPLRIFMIPMYRQLSGLDRWAALALSRGASLRWRLRRALRLRS